jgi:hypothetical protein
MCQIAADAVDVLSSKDNLRKYLIDEDSKYIKPNSNTPQSVRNQPHVKQAAHGYHKATL